jgi:hypothetical protein
VSGTVASMSKRNFYNMLSPPDGQEIAANAGITPSSDEVYEEEQRDILRSWSYLTTAGIVESLSDAADWMSERERLPVRAVLLLCALRQRRLRASL